MQTFSLSTELPRAWEMFKKNWQVLLPVVLIMAVIQMLPGDNLALVALAWIVSLFLYPGIIAMGLNLVRGKTIALPDMYSRINQFVPYALTSIVLGIVFSIGFFAFIIPGVFLVLRYAFVLVVLVDEPTLQPMKAADKAVALTKGHYAELLMIIVVLAIINLIGMIPFGLGLLITTPVSGLVALYYYEYLKGLK